MRLLFCSISIQTYYRRHFHTIGVTGARGCGVIPMRQVVADASFSFSHALTISTKLCTTVSVSAYLVRRCPYPDSPPPQPSRLAMTVWQGIFPWTSAPSPQSILLRGTYISPGGRYPRVGISFPHPGYLTPLYMCAYVYSYA